MVGAMERGLACPGSPRLRPDRRAGGLGPAAPFTGKPHWRTFTNLPVPWSQSEISGYIDYCRLRVRDTLVGMTVEKASVMLPPAHRYRGRPYAWLVTSLIGHTTAHAIQIRQFSTTAFGALDSHG